MQFIFSCLKYNPTCFDVLLRTLVGEVLSSFKRMHFFSHSFCALFINHFFLDLLSDSCRYFSITLSTFSSSSSPSVLVANAFSTLKKQDTRYILGMDILNLFSEERDVKLHFEQSYLFPEFHFKESNNLNINDFPSKSEYYY